MATTPEQMPNPGAVTGTIAISEARKQMLVENLQLEITERARRLRSQYAMQAQGLRTRLEMRVNRIPHALRHANMQELVDKYSQPQTSKPLPAPPSPQKISYPVLSSATGNARGVKRTRYDKENEHPAGVLENPKKRVKTTGAITAVPTKTGRTASRKPGPDAVLSPKSHNSRTLPASPIKFGSPVKESALPKPTARGVAPMTTAKAARPASRQTKRPVTTAAPNVAAQATKEASGLTAHNRPSTGSDDSNGTTIVKKQTARATGTTASAAAKKAAAASATKSRTQGIKNALSSLTGSKRGAASKKGAAVAPTATVAHAASTTTVGGRTLRKRGSLPSSAQPGQARTASRGSAHTGVLTEVSSATIADQDSAMSTATASASNKAGQSPSSGALVRKGAITRSTDRVSSGRVEKGQTRKLGSRRIGKLVEKTRHLLTRSKFKAN